MRRRLIALAVVGAFAVAVGVAAALADGSSPSGERILGGPGFGSGNPVINTNATPPEPVAGAVIEPAYDNGSITYILTPAKTPNPVKSNPIAAAPIYLPVYPVGTPSSVVTTAADLNCNHLNMVGSTQVDNCPDHGDAIAGLAAGFGDPGVYGGGVLGHDHVLDGPASHGDFNIAWIPEVILFNSNGCAENDPLCNVTHLTSNSEIEAAIDAGTVDVVKLDGSGGLPDLTFHCSVVSQAVWNKAVPWPGTVGS